MGNIYTVNNNGVTFRYGNDVRPNAKKVIQDAVFDAQNKSENKEFFSGLKLTVFSSWGESEQFKNLPETSYGFTTYPVFDENKNIFLQINDTKNLRGEFNDNYVDYAQIKENTLHELGHIFDFHFATPDEEVVQKLKETMNAEDEPTKEDYAKFDALFAEYKKQNGLSDSEEYKQAWKADVEREFKGNSKFKNIIKADKLGYFSPINRFEESSGKIKLADGIDDRELDFADQAREEVFAQLFAYALGAEGKNHNKKLILKTYQESYKVVQNFVEKFLKTE